MTTAVSPDDSPPSIGQVRGFALVATLSMLLLLMVMAMGVLSLASIELRNTVQGEHQARARANAKLALVLALAELQSHAGPDTRATAPASILAENGIAHPHWTGVWSTRRDGEKSLLARDDAQGGLTDSRSTEWDREKAVRAWLVSGSEMATKRDPRDQSTGRFANLVGRGSVGSNLAAHVSAPLIQLASEGRNKGTYAWWIGDLGIKANIATPDAHEPFDPLPGSESSGGWFRMLASQEADTSRFIDPGMLDAVAKRRLLTEKTSALMQSDVLPRTPSFHDFTTASEGILADMAEGGLKRDLTAYLQSDGTVGPRGERLGIRDDDNLVGPANPEAAALAGLDWDQGKHNQTSPKFGLLRRWALAEAPFANANLASVAPKSEPSPRVDRSDELALSNLKPATLTSLDRPSLLPVLVEASTSFSLSWYRRTASSGGIAPKYPYDIRQHFYPRVVLWNPYNVELTLDRTIVVIQGNGRQEMWMDGTWPGTNFGVRSQWIFFEGGRNPVFGGGAGILESSGYKDPYIGSFYYTIPKTTFGPGECLVFSPAEAAEYNGTVVGQEGYSAIDSNLLTCEKPPHPSRNFYLSDNNVEGGINFVPTEYWFAPTDYWTRMTGRNGIENQGDDCRVILKLLGERSNISFTDFDALPQLAVISASLQYGGGREPRIAWNIQERVRLEELSYQKPMASQKPNVRTREGIRLRWFDEHQSNKINSGALVGTPHFEEALLANWNLRAAYATRSPYDNIAGSLPLSGSAGGPWFFGAYTRDLYDEAVSWDAQMPVPRGGRYHGNPFGTPQESGGRPIVLFDVPRDGAGVISLGQFQHLKLSEFIWHPGFAFGHSLADPRVAEGPLQGLDRTARPIGSDTSTQYGGFNPNRIGWSNDSQRSDSKDSWADQARAIYQDYPTTEILVYDLSFEVNHSLWDRFFLSTGSPSEKGEFLEDPLHAPLPNGRMRLAPATGALATADRLADFHDAAYFLSVDGAFNVNSTSVEAWKAVLGATRRASAEDGTVTFPRVLDPPGGEWTADRLADDNAAWSGKRTLREREIDRLAEAIVAEVRRRGPFLSLADFVNRRLANDETGRMGALQAAIEAAGLNATFEAAYPLDNREPLRNYRHPDNISDATGLEQTLKPSSKAWGLPGYFTQGDLLQVLGPMLNARSDTFIIRTYGDSLDADGRIQARVWCEAIVQRTPEPIVPDSSGLDSANQGQPHDLGRRFAIKSFRWLAADEV
jgi:Tfp pilus assembly protein PilX